MRILLDIHVLLWALKGINDNGEEFPEKAKDILLNSQNEKNTKTHMTGF